MCCGFSVLSWWLWYAGVQMYDRWRVQRAQTKQGVAAHPWEAKGGLLYHIDLGLDLIIRVCCVIRILLQCISAEILHCVQPFAALYSDARATSTRFMSRGTDTFAFVLALQAYILPVYSFYILARQAQL